jgi:hypothetical protein
MTVNIRVYPSKLNSSVYESLECEAGLTIEQWLKKAVPAYKQLDDQLFSILLEGVEVGIDFWDITVLKNGNLLECFVEPKDPVTATLVVIAVVSAAAAIYYANQPIPDTYNSTVPKGSSIYTVNAQGNQPRLMGVLPESFGTHKLYPDHLNQLRRLYLNNEEFLYLMLSVGVGRYSIDSDFISIGDTPVGSYGSDIDYELFEPAQDVTSHEANKNTYVSKEVGATSSGGLELLPSEFDAYYESGTGTGGSQYQIRIGPYSPNMDPPSGAKYINLRRWLNTGWIEPDFPAFEADTYREFWATGPVNLNGVIGIDGRLDYGSKETLPAFDFSDVPYNTYTNALIRIFREGAGGDYAGPFYACPVGVSVEKFRVVLRFPQGLAQLDGASVNSKKVTVGILWKADGAAPGEWNRIVKTYTASTLDELIFTEEITVPAGTRPQVMVANFNTLDDDIQVKDKLEWYRLESDLPAVSSYAGITTMAMKIKGTNVLASTAENKINLIAKRILPTFNDSGVFGVEQPTDDIAPVVKYLADAAELPVDMDELWRLHQIWKARGDTFSAVFDDETTIWEALKRVLAVGFAEPTLDYGMLIPIRDEKRESIRYMYGPQNTLPNSWKMSATLFDASEPDGVEVEYMDGTGGTWKPEVILCTLPGELGLKPEKVRAYGITDRNKAYQFGMRKRSAIRYRRKQYKFSTEMDGLNSNYLSYDGLGIEMPSYSQTGSLLSFDGRVLTLSEDVEFAAGTHYITLRKSDGTASGPYICTQVSASNEVIINTDLDFSPVVNGRQEPPFFMFGTAESWCERVLIKDIKPVGTDRVNLTAINDDDRVYLYDDALVI